MTTTPPQGSPSSFDRLRMRKSPVPAYPKNPILSLSKDQVIAPSGGLL